MQSEPVKSQLGSVAYDASALAQVIEGEGKAFPFFFHSLVSFQVTAGSIWFKISMVAGGKVQCFIVAEYDPMVGPVRVKNIL